MRAPDAPSPEPEGLEDREFPDPLPGGHGHGVGRHGDDDDDHHERDEADDHDDGLGHGDEAEDKGLLRLRECLGHGVLEGRIHGGGHVGRVSARSMPTI